MSADLTFARVGALIEASTLNNPYASPNAPLTPACHGGYFAVARRKFAIMLIITGGTYATYWCYRQWKAYTQVTGGNQWAWARGLFWWLFAYNLFVKLDAELQERGQSIEWSHRRRGLVVLTAASGSLLLSLLNPVYALLPQVLLTLLSAFMLIGTLPAVNALANDLNGEGNSRLTWANWIWLLVGILMWIIAVGGVALMLAFPDTAAG